MTPVPVWRLFAFKNDDPDGLHDETRMITDWQVYDVIGWAKSRGYDTILLTRTDQTKSFEKGGTPTGIRHH